MLWDLKCSPKSQGDELMAREQEKLSEWHDYMYLPHGCHFSRGDLGDRETVQM